MGTSHRQFGRIFNRQILEGMDGAIHAAREQFSFEFLGEESLATNFRQMLVKDFVALRGDDSFFTEQVRVGRLQGRDDPLRLPASKSRGTGGKDQFHV
jgi:hypothetical protein